MSQCYATVVLYYTCDIACQIVFRVQFFKFTFTLLAVLQLHKVLPKVVLLFFVGGHSFSFCTPLSGLQVCKSYYANLDWLKNIQYLSAPGSDTCHKYHTRTSPPHSDTSSHLKHGIQG